MNSSITAGLTATMNYRVPADRTVPHLLPEAPEFTTMPDVLATGYLVALVEWTCMQTVTPHLQSRQRTLGVHVDLSHEAATPPGAVITIGATLTAVNGRRLTFEVTARDDDAVICRGRHQRAIVDLERFQQSVAARQASKVNEND
jgi:fluoroacetyl-CoA thioesterase